MVGEAYPRLKFGILTGYSRYEHDSCLSSRGGVLATQGSTHHACYIRLERRHSFRLLIHTK